LLWLLISCSEVMVSMWSLGKMLRARILRTLMTKLYAAGTTTTVEKAPVK
jgi:hypothetical protein